MITIDRNLIRQVLPVFKRALVGSQRTRLATRAGFLASPEGLQIRIASPEVAVEYRIAGNYEPVYFAVPLELLVECQGRGPDPVQFHVSDSNVLVEWTDGAPSGYRWGAERKRQLLRREQEVG